MNLVPDGPPDGNGRTYPKSELDKAIEEFNSRIPVLCQLDASEFQGILLESASHNIVGLDYKYAPDVDTRSTKIVGLEISFNILDTPRGKVLDELLFYHNPTFNYAMSGIVNDSGVVTQIKFLNFGLHQIKFLNFGLCR